MGTDKDWLLIANYLDFNHILNATGFTIAALLEMPFTVQFKPVELYMNGNYEGLYLLTEQIEKDNNRVEIDDEGVLLELDTYYNDINKFRSQNYSLPINIKYPKTVDASGLNTLRNDFNTFESLVSSPDFPKTKYKDYFDISAYCDYMIVTYLTDNLEINHPKSTFMYKNAKGKYTMGPVWDFDWGFSFQYNRSYFNYASGDLFWKTPGVGTRFFSRLITDPEVKKLFKQKWTDFRAKKFSDVLVFIDNYSKIIEKPRNADLEKWNLNNRDFNTEILNLKTWLGNKATFIDNMVKGW
jgi:hypothetical protein